MNEVPKTWNGEKRLYEKQFYSVLRRRTHIIDIDPVLGELGFTAEDGNIHLAYSHPIMDVLGEKPQIVFRYGVFTHETLHQVFTNFAYLREVIERHTDHAEQRVLVLFANLVEDPAIEYFATQVFGGEMLEALRFSIGHIYKETPELEMSESPFTQLINALVMFGDMGLLKGPFTFPEAEEYFKKIAPSFNRMVVEPDAKKRIDAAEQWTVLTRPLWKKEAKKENEFLAKLQDLLDDLMNGGMEGSGEPLETPKKGELDDAAKRREQFAAKLEEEAEEESDEGSGESTSSENSDESPDSSTEDSEVTPDGSVEDAAEESGSQDELSKASGSSEKSAIDEFQDDGAYSVPEPSADVVKDVWERVQKEARDLSNSNDTLDLPVSIPRVKGSRRSQDILCKNRKIEAVPGCDGIYKRIVNDHARDIRVLTNSLRSIFRADFDDYLRATSGRYALKRDLDHTSVKIFDKKKARKNIEDCAVLLLVDSSGSMQGRKMQLAKETAIILSEVFAALKIPCYIMGFTADTDGAEVVHDHFVSWRNTKEERQTLVSLNASANNDDGYSICYATQILQKRRAEHKILFVISDGAPACNRYRYTNGVHDTALAIKAAKKVSDIFGIGIGIEGCQELKEMYKGAYVNVRDINTLAAELARQLKRVIRAWL